MTERRSLVALTIACLVLSGIGPHDRFTWALEVAPILIGLPILIATAKSDVSTEMVAVPCARPVTR